MQNDSKCLSGACELQAKKFAEFIVRNGLEDEAIGNVGTKTDDGELGFAKIYEDPKDGEAVALGVRSIDDLYEKFASSK